MVAKDPILLNLALNLSLEFGTEWRRPITDRLLSQAPYLSRDEAEKIDHLCAEVRDWANEITVACVLDNVSTEAEARKEIRDRHPWIDESTLERLWNQGCYYAMKQ